MRLHMLTRIVLIHLLSCYIHNSRYILETVDCCRTPWEYLRIMKERCTLEVGDATIDSIPKAQHFYPKQCRPGLQKSKHFIGALLYVDVGLLEV